MVAFLVLDASKLCPWEFVFFYQDGVLYVYQTAFASPMSRFATPDTTTPAPSLANF